MPDDPNCSQTSFRLHSLHTQRRQSLVHRLVDKPRATRGPWAGPRARQPRRARARTSACCGVRAPSLLALRQPLQPQPPTHALMLRRMRRACALLTLCDAVTRGSNQRSAEVWMIDRAALIRQGVVTARPVYPTSAARAWFTVQPHQQHAVCGDERRQVCLHPIRRGGF